jgi:hypothetical protein
MWVIAACASVTAANKHEYFEDGVVDELKDIVDDYNLEGWLIIVVLMLLVLCCCGKVMSCLMTCCHRTHENTKPLLALYHHNPRQQCYVGELTQNQLYMPPTAPPTAPPLDDRSVGLVYPYLPPVERR